MLKFFPSINLLEFLGAALNDRILEYIFTTIRLSRMIIMNSHPRIKNTIRSPWLTLKHLQVDDMLIGKFLPQLPNLTSLDLFRCIPGPIDTNIPRHTYILGILKKCPNLKELRVRYNSLIDLDKFFDEVCDVIPKLEKFHFDIKGHFKWTCISKWQHLRELRLQNLTMDNRVVRQLFTQIPTLQVITRTHYRYRFVSRRISELLRN